MKKALDVLIDEIEALWRAGYSKSEIKARLARRGLRWNIDYERAFNRFGLGGGR